MFTLFTEELHVEHRNSTVQSTNWRRVRRTLQSHVRIRLRFLENRHFSFPRCRVSLWYNHSFIPIHYIHHFSIPSMLLIIICHRVATGNPVVFTLTPPECYMEIRYGYGTSGNRVTGPVRVGDPLTLIIYMRSKYGMFGF